MHWYAVKVRWKRTGQVCDMLDRKGVDYYTQKIVPSFMFIHTDEATVQLIRHEEYENGFNRIHVYVDKESHRPIGDILTDPAAVERYSVVPERCRDCSFLSRCNGGCRAASEQVYGSFAEADPVLEIL